MGSAVSSIMGCCSELEGNRPNAEVLAHRSYGLQSRIVDDKNQTRIMSGVQLPELNALRTKWSSQTLVESLQKTCATRGSRTALTYRTIVRVEPTQIPIPGTSHTKKWEFLHMSEPTDMTYREFWTHIESFGAGLRELLQSGTNIERPRIAIYEETRWEWLATCYAAWTQNMTVVTVYANLGEDALEYAIGESECRVIVCGLSSLPHLVPIFKKLVSRGATTPKVICIGGGENGSYGDISVVDWFSVVRRGSEIRHTDVAALTPPHATDIALVMYTSGTTGNPKGVVVAHGAVNASVSALNDRLTELLGPPPSTEADSDRETYVCYLPLAHILEFACENLFLERGSRLCFGSARTLTNSTARPMGDLALFRPSLFVGVPRIFDTVHKAVEANISAGVKRKVWDRAYHDRLHSLKQGLDTPYWNDHVFAEPRKIFGNRLRAMVSGGAPLAASTQEFMTVVFGVSVVQGYGLTETCSCATTQRLGDLVCENVGQPLRTAEIKLVDVDHWRGTNMPNPQGEICVRGPFNSSGYFRRDDLTKAAFDDDGWFHTGDVGEWSADGSLKVIGRVKALAKNSLGEYVALEALECVYVQNDLALPNGVCVLVDPHKPFIAALVLTDEQRVSAFAKRNGFADEWPGILGNADFRKKVTESFVATAKAVGKRPFEFVKAVHLLNEEWTPENDVLTAAMKLKRRVIDQRYADVIMQLFSESNASPL